ncbi:HBR065Wp [Eremothecium sinecaudum]|uniref:HBR065Wp n=1 Tax=Eremothecium sinecaudum TaxID=45286 RepID=A0A125RDZ1_9SACH|nr:HBR065Wp [Eremothecium sinecaudum]AMD18966.1 HBR065Wp [Eremothecium sinecaudum]
MNIPIGQWSIDPNKLSSPYQSSSLTAGQCISDPGMKSASHRPISMNINMNMNMDMNIDIPLNLNSTDYDAKSRELSTDINSESQQPESSYFGINHETYHDIDEFLVQELRELDIPLAPSVHEDAADGLYSKPKIDDSTLSMFANGLEKAGFKDGIFDSYHHQHPLTPRKTHNREPSGTAIFGFVNHNHNLTINRPVHESSINAICGSADVAYDNMCIKEDGLPTVNTLILKQQEELGLALEKQKEVNRRLQEQLKINQLQQQQLQEALCKKEAAARQTFSDSSCIATPRNVPRRSDSILVTSNSKSGGYQFPPPRDETTSFVLSPSTGSISVPQNKESLPGKNIEIMSLVRENEPEGTCNRLQWKKLGNLPMHRPHTVSGRINYQCLEEDSLDKSHYQNQSNENAKSSSHISSSPRNHLFSNSSPKLPYASPINDKHHRSKRSVTSTASTIPMSYEEDSDVESLSCKKQQVNTIGLGLNYKEQNSKSAFVLNKPPQLGLLPTIPGSNNNTPIKRKDKVPFPSPGYPPKYCFQHISVNDSKHQSTRTTMDQATNYSLEQNIFDSVQAANLKPPDISYKRYRRDTPDTADECDEPIQEFVQAQSPSPILLSQKKFDNTHQLNTRSLYDGAASLHPTQSAISSPERLSPMKKASNLPQEEIDQYIRKLEDKTFECLYPDCNKLFNRRYNIRSHIQTHLEDRPFKCDFVGCTKAFVRNHDLIRHKKTHAEKVYICPCSKKFSREDALLTHRARMICIGGKKFENIVIKRSPRKRGRPKKDGYSSTNSSPVKEVLANDHNGTVILKMEEQLQKVFEQSGSEVVQDDTIINEIVTHKQPNSNEGVRTPLSLPKQFSSPLDEVSS